MSSVLTHKYIARLQETDLDCITCVFYVSVKRACRGAVIMILGEEFRLCTKGEADRMTFE